MRVSGVDAEVAESVKALELETVEDLAFAYTSADAADRAGHLHVWRAAKELAQSGVAKVLQIIKSQSARERDAREAAKAELREQSTEVTVRSGGASSGRGPRPVRQLLWLGRAAKPKPVATQSADDAVRMEAARRAVDLSWKWQPVAGLAPKKTMTPELVERLKLSQVKRMAKFEARTINQALNMWSKWQEYCAAVEVENKVVFEEWLTFIVDEDTQWLVQEFIDEADTATGPLHRYSTLKWLKDHLKAPIALDVPKPQVTRVNKSVPRLFKGS